MQTILANFEAFLTLACVAVTFGIAAGPMTYMKLRYRFFMLFVSICVLASVLDRATEFYARENVYDDSVHITALILYLISKSGICITGTYIIYYWAKQCNRIKEQITRQYEIDIAAAARDRKTLARS